MSSIVNGTTTTTNFLYDNSMLVRERRNGTNYATYLTGPRGPEYRRDDTTGNVSWYIYDGLGSVVAEVNPSGTVTSSRKYDVFGSVRGGTNPSGTSKQKFVGGLGHVSDDETGYVYMRARYMDPTIGRFVSEDPSGQGTNWFAYCSNNPVNNVDADGKVALWVTIVLTIISAFSRSLGAWLQKTFTDAMLKGTKEAIEKWTAKVMAKLKDLTQGLFRSGGEKVAGGELENSIDPTDAGSLGIEQGGSNIAESAVDNIEAEQLRTVIQMILDDDDFWNDMTMQ